jgi:DNA-binding NarL/FixJ family response regulator
VAVIAPNARTNTGRYIPSVSSTGMPAMCAKGGEIIGRSRWCSPRPAGPTADLATQALERARVRAALGSALHRAGRSEDAREPLRLAVDLAHRCGAWALEKHAVAELRATGARPRRRLATGTGALTPSERRIAELAAAGQLNREIAETLFVTTNTVEYHLRNAYRKLGISSRTQLAEALGAQSER